MIRSVIFDLGGTLINFDGDAKDWRGMEERGVAALYRHLAELGYTLPEHEFNDVVWEEMRRGWNDAMSGRDNACLPDVIARAMARCGVSLEDKALMRAARVYASGVEQGITPLEGAREVLRQLKARGLRLGLLSNTTWPSQFHQDELEYFGLLEFFDKTAYSCEIGFWKPSEPAFRYVTDRLGVSPAESVYVGDQPQTDVLGAQQAGLRTVWISTNGRDAGDVKPDAVIHRLAELPAVLDQLNIL